MNIIRLVLIGICFFCSLVGGILAYRCMQVERAHMKARRLTMEKAKMEERVRELTAKLNSGKISEKEKQELVDLDLELQAEKENYLLNLERSYMLLFIVCI